MNFESCLCDLRSWYLHFVYPLSLYFLFCEFCSCKLRFCNTIPEHHFLLYFLNALINMLLRAFRNSRIKSFFEKTPVLLVFVSFFTRLYIITCHMVSRGIRSTILYWSCPSYFVQITRIIHTIGFNTVSMFQTFGAYLYFVLSGFFRMNHFAIVNMTWLTYVKFKRL